MRATTNALAETLAAISYGEWKAHTGALDAAAATDDPSERAVLEQIAREELRHFDGFTAKLRELGVDPDEAMTRYRTMLDTYHGSKHASPLQEAVWSYLGEGVAEDLLAWFRGVADDDTQAFIDTVIEDEAGHEHHATMQLRDLIASTPGGRRKAGRAARRMLVHMAASGRHAPPQLGSFLLLGRPGELIGRLVSGHVRRMAKIGLLPLGTPLPGR